MLPMSTGSSSARSPVLSSTSVVLGEEFAVSRIGYGSLQLCGPNGWGDRLDRDTACRLIREAIDLGVTFIDTAEAYGPFTAERIVGRAIRGVSETVVVATKGGMRRGPEGNWIPDGSPKSLITSCEASLRRLNLSCIPLYQLHVPDPAIPFEDSVGTLAELRERGLIRHVGLSNVSVAQLDAAQGIVPIASVQNGYNLKLRDAEDVLWRTVETGTIFVPWFPLDAGNLAAEQSLLARIAKDIDATPAQIALAWLLRQAPNIIVIPGTASLEHLAENVRCIDVAIEEPVASVLDRWHLIGARAAPPARP